MIYANLQADWLVTWQRTIIKVGQVIKPIAVVKITYSYISVDHQSKCDNNQ